MHALAHPPDDIGGRRPAGHDDDFGERRADDLVHHRLDPAVDRRHRGHAHGEVLDRQQRFTDDAAREPRSERGLHLFPLTGRESVGEVVVVRDVDGDPPRVALADHVGEEVPLVRAPQLRLPSVRGGGRGAHGFIHASLRTASQSQALHPVFRSAVVEDVDGPPAGRESRRRDEGREDGILVVLPHCDDPHVHAVLPHEHGQVRLEPLRQPRLLRPRLLPKRPERALRPVVPRLRLERRHREPGHPAQRQRHGREARDSLHLPPPILGRTVDVERVVPALPHEGAPVFRQVPRQVPALHAVIRVADQAARIRCRFTIH